MIITLIATGSRGDVQPYVALGRGLRQAGHAVRFVTPRNFDALAATHELEVWPVETNIEAIAGGNAMRDRVEGGNFLRLMAEMSRAARVEAVRLAGVALDASRGADLILVGSHGRGAAGRFLLGSVSTAIALHAPCSVEIVRQRKT